MNKWKIFAQLLANVGWSSSLSSPDLLIVENLRKISRSKKSIVADGSMDQGAISNSTQNVSKVRGRNPSKTTLNQSILQWSITKIIFIRYSTEFFGGHEKITEYIWSPSSTVGRLKQFPPNSKGLWKDWTYIHRGRFNENVNISTGCDNLNAC
jgi:hypothetical protein